MAAPATQTPDVKGVQKVMLPIVRRKVPAGYTADRRRWKKGKKGQQVPTNEEGEQDSTIGAQQPKSGTSTKDNLSRAFEGDRPKHKPKTKFFFLKNRKRKDENMGPQLFSQEAPYKDLEFMTKFWRGSKNNDDAFEPTDQDKIKKKQKVKKGQKPKPQGTYQPDIQPGIDSR